MTSLEHIDNYYFKREDENITGSAKDRALPYQIQNLIKLGYKSAVISSTGNAAISAEYFCQLNNIKLTVFVSPHTDIAKLRMLKSPTISSPQPISDAIKYAKSNNSYLLRQSTDPTAITGYSDIGKEIISQLPSISCIFIPIGSGTTLLGVTQTLSRVKIFGVQSAYNPTVTTNFQPSVKENINLVDALTVKYLPLKTKIIEIINNSQGGGITVTNQELLDARAWLQNHHISTSNEGALTLAGAFLAKKKYDIGDFPVILLTGQKR